MCNWMNKANGQFQKYGHRFVEDSFPQFTNHLPPSNVRANHCLCCGRPLSYQEMFPPGHPPRYMCRGCYENIAYTWPNDRCLSCGGQLPFDQVQQRIGNPRELSYALHKGPCDDYHSVLAGIVLGLPFRTKSAPAPAPGLLGGSLDTPALLQAPQPRQPLLYQPVGTTPFHQFLDSQIITAQRKPTKKIKYLGFPK